MKSIVFLITGLFLGLNAICQQSSPSEVVSMTIPGRAIKLPKEDVRSFVKNNGFMHSQLVFENRRKFYQVDGLIVSFWDIPMSPTYKRSLQTMQSEGLGILRGDKENVIKFSKIVSINNIQFLIYEYQKGDEVFLRFISDVKNNNNLAGIIQFKKKDEEKAQNVLQELLQSMHFK